MLIEIDLSEEKKNERCFLPAIFLVIFLLTCPPKVTMNEKISFCLTVENVSCLEVTNPLAYSV